MQLIHDAADRFRGGHAASRDWQAAVDSCVEQMLPLPPAANVGFVYLTDRLADRADDIVQRLRDATGVETFVGMAGLGICAQGAEYFDEPALSVLLGVFPPAGVQVMTRPDKRMSGALGVIHADPSAPALAEAIEDLAIGSGAALVGGLSASRRAEVLIAGDEVLQGAVSGLFLADVPVVTAVSQGCAPLGPVREVIAAEGNVIAQLDGMTALDALKEDVGPELAADMQRAGRMALLGIMGEGDGADDYVARHLTGIDPRNGLLAVGALVEPGMRVMFVRRDRAAAEADLDRMLADVVRRAAGRPIRAALYFSCLGRGPNMFGPDSAELRRIAAALGDAPLAGCFCNGEIAGPRLYGYTGVLAAFV